MKTIRQALALLLFAQAHLLAQEIPCAWSNVDRVVAVGDVHTDISQLIACLRASGVMDDQQQWIGGKTHLVQLGDLLDPGSDLKKVMDLLMALEFQAQEAGGRVHALLGNHELMLLDGNPDELGGDQVASFGGLADYRKAMGVDGKYGKWIRSHNTVIRINDLLFVHGGLSAEYAALSLAAINNGVRAVMNQPATGHWADDPKRPPRVHVPAQEEPSRRQGDRDAADNPALRVVAHDPQGPLWFRGLALEEDSRKLGGMLAPILQGYGVKHVIIGHTITRTREIALKAGGALIMTDVGMSETYGRAPAMCLVIEKGKFFSVTPEKKLELRAE